MPAEFMFKGVMIFVNIGKKTISIMCINTLNIEQFCI